jgi:hypothetical protein
MSVTRKGERSEAKVEFMKDGKEGDNFTFELRTVDLCLDDDGDRITSCVVDLVESKPTTPRTMDITAEDMDAAMPPAKPKSGTAAPKAFGFLEKAIAEKGETGLSNGRIPPDTPVVMEETWRDYCHRGGISRADTPGARQRAFYRAKDKLMEDKFVDEWDRQVWIIR